MRVLFPFVGDTIGGSHISALELIANLPEEGVEPIIVLHQDGPLANYLDERRIAYIKGYNLPFFSPKKRLYKQHVLMWRTAPRLARFLISRRIDCVHTNDSRMHVSWVAPAQKSGVVHVWHQRNTWDFKNQNAIAGRSSQILTISDHCRKSFHPDLIGSVKKVWDPVTLQEPLNGQSGTRNLREDLGLPEQTRLIAFIANFMARKRPEMCVKIAGKLVDRGCDDFMILMFGDPREPFGTTVQQMIADENLSRHCRVYGPAFPVIPLLKQCDALIAPAVNEGFGRTLVEAMLCDIPVVAADDGGHAEIIQNGKTGYLVPPDSAEDFAARLISLFDNPGDANVMKNNAKDMAVQRFSGKAHAATVGGIYRQLIINTQRAVS